jgi:hypothetical protein
MSIEVPVNVDSVSLVELRQASAALILDWARAALPFYGPSGSMDLDLDDIPDAAGPSYYNQFAHWPLLMLASGVLPGAGVEERRRFRAAALRNIEYVLSITDAEFHTPHYSMGRDWGRHIGEWSNFFLMKSLLLMRERELGEPELRGRLERAVRGAVARIHDAFLKAHGPASPPASRFPGNHAAWHGLLLVEAGIRFREKAWTDLGTHFFRTRVLPFQLPSGCWPEGGGIVVGYSMVTAQALSLYAELTGDGEAVDAIARYLSFSRLFTLPDGSSAVVADCRQRYHPRPSVFLPPLFVRDAGGRADCLHRIRGFHESLGEGGAKPPGVQALAFFANVADSLAREEESDAGTLRPLPVTGADVARVGSGPWTALVSWQLVEETPSRWILDSQNFLEIHHAVSGYLVGGGNGKYQPRFSTLRRRSSGRAYVPEVAAALEASATRAAVSYGFGGDRLELGVEASPEGVRVSFRVAARVDGAAAYEGAVMLDVRPGEQIRCGEREYVVDPSGLIEHTFGLEGGTVAWRGRLLRVPAGATLVYPVVPHNPYRQDGLPAPEAYAARVAVDVGETAVELALA